MQKSPIIIVSHLFVLLLGVGAATPFVLFPIELGAVSVLYRFLLALGSILMILIGLFPFIPWFSRHLALYLILIVVPASLGSGWYFYSFLPDQAIGGVSGEQLASDLISERTSNGIIEIGFEYPVYTPTIRIKNHDLYTREFDIFLRILDGNNDPALFRAVRAALPDERLSVEATINGLLSENPEYIFLPVAVPPVGTVEGRVVFIISNLNDGTTFNEALGRSYPASFEIREHQTGELLDSFAMTGI